MVLGGAASFLLDVNRPYIYVLSFPLVKKIKKDQYGEYLYKIGISTQERADKRLDSYLTYFSPFSYELHFVLVFPKDTKKDLVKKTEQQIFDKLHALKNEARVYPTSARINRYTIQDRDSREWWETSLKTISRVFISIREELKKKHDITTYLVRPEHLNYKYSLTSKSIPNEIRLSKEEAQKNKEEQERIHQRALEYFESIGNTLTDRFKHPAKYFKIDESFI